MGRFTDDDRDLYYVAAGKATLAMAGRIVTPLSIPVPAPAAEPCSDVIALRAALADAGRRERRTFYVNHIGGLVVNLTGAIILAERRSLAVGALSLAIGIPVGLAASYTQPRNSWHLWRERRESWTAGMTASMTMIVGPRGIGVAGAF